MRWGLGSSDFARRLQNLEVGRTCPAESVYRGILIPSNASGFQLYLMSLLVPFIFPCMLWTPGTEACCLYIVRMLLVIFLYLYLSFSKRI